MSKRRSVQRGRLGLCQVTSLSPAVSGKEAKREVGSKVFGPFKKSTVQGQLHSVWSYHLMPPYTQSLMCHNSEGHLGRQILVCRFRPMWMHCQSGRSSLTKSWKYAKLLQHHLQEKSYLYSGRVSLLSKLQGSHLHLSFNTFLISP